MASSPQTISCLTRYRPQVHSARFPRPLGPACREMTDRDGCESLDRLDVKCRTDIREIRKIEGHSPEVCE
jgi:hypothetical protein